MAVSLCSNDDIPQQFKGAEEKRSWGHSSFGGAVLAAGAYGCGVMNSVWKHSSLSVERVECWN